MKQKQFNKLLRKLDREQAEFDRIKQEADRILFEMKQQFPDAVLSVGRVEQGVIRR